MRENSDGMRNNIFELTEGRSRLNIRKKFSLRVGRSWRKLPREAVEVFMGRLDPWAA